MSTQPQETDHLSAMEYRGAHSARERYKVNFEQVTEGHTDYEHADRELVEVWNQANAISSEIKGTDLHMPALDIDHFCQLIPSTTYGHFHLYINVRMTWWRYRVMLWALKYAGVIEPGYYKAALYRKATFLRLPEVKK